MRTPKHLGPALAITYLVGAVLTFGNACHYFRPVIEKRSEQGTMQVLFSMVFWPLYVSMRLQEESQAQPGT